MLKHIPKFAAVVAVFILAIFTGDGGSAFDLAGLSSLGGLVLLGEVDINALKNKRGELLALMEGINDAAESEDRDLTEDELADYTSHKDEAQKLANRISRAEELERDQMASLQPVNGPGGLGHGLQPGVSNIILPPAVARRRLPSAAWMFKGETAKEDAYKCGMWILATFIKHEGAAAWCENHGVPIVKAGADWFKELEGEGQLSAELKAGGIKAAMGTERPGSGYLIPIEFEDAILEVRERYGVFRGLAEYGTMSGTTLEQPKKNKGLIAYATAEKAAITESEQDWGQVLFTARKWAVLTRWSSELDEDSVISMAASLARDIGMAFAYKEDLAGFTGDGSAPFNSITGVNAVLTDGSHDMSKHQLAATKFAFNDVTEQDLVDTKAKIPSTVTMPVWITSTTGKAQIFDRLALGKGGVGKTEWAGREVPSFDGDPILVSQVYPRTPAATDMLALYGDLSFSSSFRERRGTAIMVSEHRYFELDQLAIRGTTRFDIQNHTFKIFDEDQTTEIPGPVIGLQGGTAT